MYVVARLVARSDSFGFAPVMVDSVHTNAKKAAKAAYAAGCEYLPIQVSNGRKVGDTFDFPLTKEMIMDGF